ncbi:hypothetical protein B0H11DRAFT_2085594 [Mycena galericulata]|nr:hypothetical protein B0H11DRAFT_2085594 [Mycena galericulata]
MFTFTKLNVCVLLALLSVKSVHGAPIDISEVTGIIESVLEGFDQPDATTTGGNLIQSGSVSQIAPSTPDSGVFTIVTSIGGPALTLAQTGATTMWNGATYTIDSDDAAATPVVGNLGDPSNSTDTTALSNSTDTTVPSASASLSALASASGSASASGVTNSTSASATSSGSASASSGASSASSASSSAKSSSSSSAKPNGSITLRPVELSTPLARGLFTVAVGIVFGAWCL